MQSLNLSGSSEMVSYAAYDAERALLYLTYHSGNTTIAYQDVSPALFEELCRAAYPDVCIRFKIQARHSFQRLAADHLFYEYKVIK